MQSGADIAGRLLRAAVLRRAPLWGAVLLPWIVLSSIAGGLSAGVWIVWDLVRLRWRVLREWPRWVDGAVPELEDSSALLEHAATPVARLQQARLLARVSASLEGPAVRKIVAPRVHFEWRWLVFSGAVALAFWGWQNLQAKSPVAPVSAARAEVVAVGIEMKVVPPAYTRVSRFETVPKDLQVPYNSGIEWCLSKKGDGAIELSDGQSLKFVDGCARWRASESIFWRWEGKRYNLKVTPDEPPQVTITTPRDMLQLLPENATSATMTLAVRDDYAVRRAVLHMTLARGSGENIRFSDREVPLPESSDPRSRNWSKQWSLAELGMEPGDELYFFVRATDNAEPPHTAVSPTYTLRLPGPVATEDESTALPMLVKPENLRSQRQIIIDTEQLVADMKVNPKLAAATVRARSESIAGDQAILRRRYGQFLGEESTLFGGDDHDEPGEKHDLVSEYGHMHDEAENATMFDESTKKILRRALSAMWDAEKALRAISPRPALPPEYKALEAIKELQQADRIYLHKTAFVPPALKEEIRMTGDVVGTKSYRRPQEGPGEGVPPELQALVKALATDGALPALWSRTAQDWIRSRIQNDEQRLAAQRAVQDVTDGCAKCRPELQAWLRGAIEQQPVVLQAQPEVDTPFTRAWRKGSKP